MGSTYTFTILWSDKCESSAEGSNSCRSDSSNDADEGSIRSKVADAEGVGGGSQLEDPSSFNNCHIDDIADDCSILLIQRRWSPRYVC